MTTLEKILIVSISVIITMMALSFYIQYKELKEQRLVIETHTVQQKQLQDNVLRSSAQFASKKDIEEIIKDNKIDINILRKDLDILNANIKAINTVSVVSTGYRIVEQPSTSIGITNPNPITANNATNDPYNYLKYQQKFQLNELFGDKKVPFGDVGFSAWQKNPWELSVLPRKYKMVTIIGQDENQRHYAYNKFVISADNKDFEIKLDSAELKEEVPANKWFFWNPKIFLGIGAGYTSNLKFEGVASLSFNFINYGRFKYRPDFNILNLGFSYGLTSNKVGIMISPVQYNIGKYVPFVSNTFIYPSVSIFDKQTYNVALGANISF